MNNLKIALVGNPNSGKTTLYNVLTGKNEHVGNWSGVTVSHKESKLKESYKKDADIIDLPGAYSIKAFTDEESISVNFIKDSNVDILINVIDVTNIERSLFFTTQLLELDITVIVALNKTDICNFDMDIATLSKKLNCSIVSISAINENGIEKLLNKAFDQKYKSYKLNLGEDNLNRQKFVKNILKAVLTNEVNNYEKTFSDKIDNIIINPLVGIPIFIIFMSFIFNLSINSIGPLLADYLVFGIETLQENISIFLDDQGVNIFLNTLLTDGIIGGVGAIIGFVPLVMVLMFLLSLLEDSGFMCRIAVIFDPLFRKVGLSGKSIIPMIVGYGCAIPGIMATRTIKDEKQKKLTALLIPFVPCGAKVPIIALFSSMFFADNVFLFPAVYLISFLVIITVGLLLKELIGVGEMESYFIIELTEYKIPSFKIAFDRMIETGIDFIKKAGTIILVCNTLVFIMASFDFRLNLITYNIDSSILAVISKPFAIILIPLGIGTWQLAAASITGFIAKEEVIVTLVTIFAMSSVIGEEFELLNALFAKESIGINAVCALSFMFFNLFTPPCFAAIGAIKSEIKSKTFLRKVIFLQFTVGYLVSMLSYQLGTIVVYRKFGEGLLASILILLLSTSILISKINKNHNKNLNEMNGEVNG